MKTMKEIKDIVSSYDDLISMTKKKIKIMGEYDSEYNTRRGIEDIEFGDDVVYVTIDDTCMGCYSSDSFDFLTSYLTLDDETLKETIIKDKEERIEKKQKEKEEKELKEKLKKEEDERKLLERLKEKYKDVE